jgi:acyl carrier protein phosphodiesterase
MNLDRMLERCVRDQWKVTDLDWTLAPRAMPKDDEVAIVQLFTDMAGIERLAAALFREQERRVSDPTLKKIFRTFVADENRHAEAAERLAAYYDVHKYKAYETNANLAKFMPRFVDAVRYLSDDVANAYVTAGELVLDIALLRSIDDYVHDGMSAEAMRLINRDESRHIAIDYHMVGYYASDAYTEKLTAKEAKSLTERARAWWTIANVLYYASPFFRDVFFQPMARIDPTGRRLREAIKRFQLLGAKTKANERPFGRFLRRLGDLYAHPVIGKLFGGVLARMAGVEREFMDQLNTDAELERARGLSFEDLAEEALAVKAAAL